MFFVKASLTRMKHDTSTNENHLLLYILTFFKYFRMGIIPLLYYTFPPHSEEQAIIILGLIVLIKESFHRTYLCSVSLTNLHLGLSAVMQYKETVLFTPTLSFLGSLVLLTSGLGHEDLSSEVIYVHQVHIWGLQELHLLAQVFCKVGRLHTGNLHDAEDLDQLAHNRLCASLVGGVSTPTSPDQTCSWAAPPGHEMQDYWAKSLTSGDICSETSHVG